MEKFKLEIAKVLTDTLNHSVSPAELETPPDRTLGDFAFPCFKLSREQRKAPPIIANEIASKIMASFNPEEISVNALGPYVNFSLTQKMITEQLLTEMLEQKNPTEASL